MRIETNEYIIDGDKMWVRKDVKTPVADIFLSHGLDGRIVTTIGLDNVIMGGRKVPAYSYNVEIVTLTPDEIAAKAAAILVAEETKIAEIVSSDTEMKELAAVEVLKCPPPLI